MPQPTENPYRAEVIESGYSGKDPMVLVLDYIEFSSGERVRRTIEMSRILGWALYKALDNHFKIIDPSYERPCNGVMTLDDDIALAEIMARGPDALPEFEALMQKYQIDVVHTPKIRSPWQGSENQPCVETQSRSADLGAAQNGI